jgi:prepilin peptidase CpaA
VSEISAAQIAALALAATAGIWDLKTRRIPNLLTFGAAGAALIFHGISGGVSALGYAALGWLVGALVFIVPFALRGLGGGDVKLLAALGAWLGTGDVLWLALYTGVAGGVMAIVVATSTGYLRKAFANIRQLLRHWALWGLKPLPEMTLERSAAPKLAYAVPIFMGTVAVIWLR